MDTPNDSDKTPAPAPAAAPAAAPAPAPADPATEVGTQIVKKIKAHQHVGSLAERKRAERIDKIAAEIAANKSTPEW
jgi:hypothetical protein